MSIDLGILIQSSGADGALVINQKGELVSSLGIAHESNIAAMISASLTMLNGLSKDLFQTELVQLTCKAESGMYIIQKFDDDNIVCLNSYDLSKVGYIMMALKSVKV